MPTPVTPFRHDCPCDRTGHWSVRKCSAQDGDAIGAGAVPANPRSAPDGFCVWRSLAHLNYLVHQGSLSLMLGGDGIYRFVRPSR